LRGRIKEGPGVSGNSSPGTLGSPSAFSRFANGRVRARLLTHHKKLSHSDRLGLLGPGTIRGA
jgi:hypothetical protein